MQRLVLDQKLILDICIFIFVPTILTLQNQEFKPPQLAVFVLLAHTLQLLVVNINHMCRGLLGLVLLFLVGFPFR